MTSHGTRKSRKKYRERSLGGVRGRLNGELYEAKHDIEKLRNALKTIAVGDWPRTRVEIYREDQQNSKHDKCLHGRRMWEDCDCCAADYAESVLQEEKSHDKQGS